jgi:ABC-type glycerol-3-phosphate transport system substrate-binding protein
MSIKRALLLSIAVMIVVAAVMAVILFLPDMASVSDQEERQEMTIIIRMMDEQDRRFRVNIIEPFEEEHNYKINVVVFDKITDVDIMLSNEAESGRYETGLVKTGAPVLGILKEYMIPLDEAAGKERVEADMNDYTDKAVEMGTFDGKAYYIPRKLEVRTMIFSKSKVADAVAGWTDHRDEIESILNAENGYGLPAGYTLESDSQPMGYVRPIRCLLLLG